MWTYPALFGGRKGVTCHQSHLADIWWAAQFRNNSSFDWKGRGSTKVLGTYWMAWKPGAR